MKVLSTISQVRFITYLGHFYQPGVLCDNCGQSEIPYYQLPAIIIPHYRYRCEPGYSPAHSTFSKVNLPASLLSLLISLYTSLLPPRLSLGPPSNTSIPSKLLSISFTLSLSLSSVVLLLPLLFSFSAIMAGSERHNVPHALPINKLNDKMVQ